MWTQDILALLLALRTIPQELIWKIEAFLHDLSPVMAELVAKHPQKLPQAIISTEYFSNLRYLRNFYKKRMHTIVHWRMDGLPLLTCQIGYLPEGEAFLGFGGRYSRCSRLEYFQRTGLESSEEGDEVGLLL